MSFNLDDVDAYKLAQLRHGAQFKENFPGPQITNMNDFNDLCFSTAAEFVDTSVTPLENSRAGQKCQAAMIQQLALNGREKPGSKLRLPIVLAKPQYFKDAWLATGSIDDAYKISVNSCITNQSPGLEQTSCIQRCGNARDALLLTPGARPQAIPSRMPGSNPSAWQPRHSDRHSGDRHSGDRHSGDRHSGDRQAGEKCGGVTAMGTGSACAGGLVCNFNDAMPGGQGICTIPAVPTPVIPGVPTPVIPGVPTPVIPGVPTPVIPGDSNCASTIPCAKSHQTDRAPRSLKIPSANAIVNLTKADDSAVFEGYDENSGPSDDGQNGKCGGIIFIIFIIVIILLLIGSLCSGSPDRSKNLRLKGQIKSAFASKRKTHFSRKR
jgi:hypothetical protein